MSRTGEKVLGIISAIFTLLAIILMAIIVTTGSAAIQDEAFNTEFEQQILNDPTLTGQDAEAIAQLVDILPSVFGVFGWGFVVALVISLILNIVGIVSISKNKNPKLAGIMFILAGLFAGIISLTSILLYIAAIMCFVRKPPVQFAEQEYYNPDQTV
ncbi:DUF4064 domain-containing protein [Psychrobacillus sp. FJAT-21963]|uniref:DUF4064 domain-containing protein n=1 Tax=Psychrobacillus sp. FJAT-21963 TaxID=1712028 RepID=UPI0006FE6FCD|nr:DUF4064 domain-containing protein [Psychrobacillus sp. FJAT-21963]KQL34974.1 hypothetical protein AN959_11535 [Psychrobacillus sp. FJAT-21963]